MSDVHFARLREEESNQIDVVYDMFSEMEKLCMFHPITSSHKTYQSVFFEDNLTLILNITKGPPFYYYYAL